MFFIFFTAKAGLICENGQVNGRPPTWCTSDNVNGGAAHRDLAGNGVGVSEETSH